MFRLNRKLLAGELSLLVRIAGQKNIIPALSTVRLATEGDVAQLLASNGDVTLFTEIPVPTGQDDWRGCIPIKQLYDIVRLTNTEEITFTPQSNQIQITWGRSRHRLPIIEFDKFPDVKGPVAGTERLTVKTIDLDTALERLLPCAARDESNTWMVKGIKLEAKESQLKLIGTNTHRLGVATIPCDGEMDLFVPLNAALLLPEFQSEEVLIWHDGKQASFNFGPRTLVARLSTGTFPNWSAFIPKHLPIEASISTKEMMGALKRADVTRDETFKTGVGKIFLSVVFIFSKEELVIDTRHSDVHGRSEESVMVESNLNGDLVYMGINPDYVMDFLRFAGEKTQCSLKDGQSVLKLTDGSNFQYLVVPTRINESERPAGGGSS